MKPLPRNANQARRLLSGATQFRLPVVPQPPSVESVKAISGSDYGWMRCDDMKQPEYFRPVGPVWAVRSLLPKGVDTVSLKSPFVPGDTIYVQEEWRAYLDDMGFALTVNYREDDTVTDIDPDSVQWEKLSDAIDWTWQPAEDMDPWMSRLYLEVLDVRVERVKDISEDDAKSEGAEGGCLNCGCEPCGCDNPAPSFKDGFIHLWQSNFPQHPFDSSWCFAFSVKRKYVTNG